MLRPIRIYPHSNLSSSGWCIFDTERSCVLLYLGFYETILECERAISNYELYMED